MEEGMTKAKLLRRMHEGRNGLEELVSQADPALMARSGSWEQWSLRDILAHLASWDRHLISWLDAGDSGEQPDLPPPTMSMEEVDSFNSKNYAAAQGKSAVDILSEFEASFRDLVARAELIPESELLDASRFSWSGGRPIWFYFAADSYWHYEEHLDQIRAIVQPASGSLEASS